MSPTTPYIEYTTYTHTKDPLHVRQRTPRSDFITLLLTHTHLANKDASTLYSAVTYPPSVQRRCNSGVSTVTAFVYDIERKPSPVTKSEYESLLLALDSFGWEHVIYSSHSHTADAYRLRLVLFPSRPMNPNEFRAAHQIVAQELGIADLVDPSTKDVARIYYWPSCPPDTTPIALHSKGTEVDVDEVLAETHVSPFSGAVVKDLPAGYVYVRPVAPVGPIDVAPLLELLGKYKGGDAKTSEDRVWKTNIIRKVYRGEDLCSANYYTTFLRVLGVLVRLFPAGTSAEEIMAVLNGSLIQTYGKPGAPHSPTEGSNIIRDMVEKDVEKRAAEDASNDAIIAALEESRTRTVEVAQRHEGATTFEELAKAQEEWVCPPFIFCVPDKCYYFPDENGYFTSGTAVDRKTIIVHLLAQGWELKNVNVTLANATHVVVHGSDMAPYASPIFSRAGRLYINQWRAPTIKATPGSWDDISAVIDSLTFNTVSNELGEQEEAHDPAAREWLLNWLAWAVQNPAGLPGTAVVCNGAAQGSGKNTLAHIMFEIMGQQNCALVKNAQLASNFNSRWVGKLFVFADEVSTREHDNIGDSLKAMVTGQTAIREAKGRDSTDVRNRSKFFFASNHSVPFKLDPQDRRFTVFTRHTPSGEEWKARLRTFFTVEDAFRPAFLVQIAAFAHYLENKDVNEDMVKTPLNNTSKRVLIAAGLPAERAFCLHVDDHGIDCLVKGAVEAHQKYRAPDRIEDLFRIAADERVFGGEWDFGDEGVTLPTLHKCYLYFSKDNNYTNTQPINKFAGAIASHGWKKKQIRTPDNKRRYVYQIPRTSSKKKDIGPVP